ncbi:MAG: IPT/TIG domain-containing protein [Dehalococcoidia bacterium]|nr:IPT/TIG domain-containing protein [Dehalococcoidia bacterium]
MTKAKVWTVLTALLLAMSMAVAAPPFVHNASALVALGHVSPEKGPVNTSVNVTGTVEPGSAYSLRWDDKFTGQVLATGHASISGDVSVSFTVPPAASDKNYHLIFLVDESDGVYDLWPFVVTPATSISASTGRTGDSIAVSGSGFGTSEKINITWNGTALSSVNANTLGSWSTTIAVPPSAGGPSNIGASGNFTAQSVDQSFIVFPSLVVSPSTGPSGTTLTIGGNGFGANEPGIEVLWGGLAVKTGIVASASGSWNTTLAVPLATAGTFKIGAKGSATVLGSVSERDFSVTRRLSLDPTVGRVGTVVTISGTGFVGNTAVSISYDQIAVVTTPAAVVSTAVGSISTTFTVPPGVPGVHSVVVSDGAGMANTTFATTSSMSIAGSSTSPGDEITITGQGFPSFAPITFTLDNMTLATRQASVTADASGAFSATVTLPETARGTRTIRGTSGGTSLTADFVVSPRFSVVPTSGGVADVVTVSGRGFGSNEAVALTFDGLAIASTPATVSASAKGNFSATIVVPPVPGGVHTVKAADTSASVQTTVIVSPQVSLTPGSVGAGGKTSANATGFPANTSVAVTTAGAAVTTSPAPITTDSRGTFKADITVPLSSAGGYTLTFAAGSAISQASFSISPILSISPDTGNAGSIISISGNGYAGSSPITVTCGGVRVETTPSVPTTTAQGSFLATFNVPKSAYGRVAIAATDATGLAVQAFFNVESMAPAAPKLLLPRDGSRTGTFGPGLTILSWSGVSDPSGVTYVLQISRDLSFEKLDIEQTGLSGTEYKLSGKEKLGRGLYYWRVKAINGSSDEGGWSQTFTLKVGLLPNWVPAWVTEWSLILVIVLVVGAAALILLLRRSGFHREY